MNPFEAVKAKLQKVTDNREQLTNDIAKLRSDVEEISDQMKDSAVNNDIDRYTRLKEQKAMKENMAEIKEFQLSQIEDVSEEEIRSEWKKYSKQHDQDFEKAMDKVNKTKQAFLTAYRELLLLQNEGNRERNKLVSLLGYDTQTRTRPDGRGSYTTIDLAQTFPMKQIEKPDISRLMDMASYRGTLCTPELAMYLAKNHDSKAKAVVVSTLSFREEEI